VTRFLNTDLSPELFCVSTCAQKVIGRRMVPFFGVNVPWRIKQSAKRGLMTIDPVRHGSAWRCRRVFRAPNGLACCAFVVLRAEGRLAPGGDRTRRADRTAALATTVGVVNRVIKLPRTWGRLARAALCVRLCRLVLARIFRVLPSFPRVA